MTYSQAKPAADSAASGYGSGGWAAIVGAGFQSTASVSEPASNLTSALNCTTSLIGSSTTVSVPAYNGAPSSGAAPAWMFLYRNGAGEILFVLEINGQATPWATTTGSACTSVFGLFSAIPSVVIDSSTAAQAAASVSAGTFFLAQHAHVNATFGILGGISFLGFGTGAMWEVAYTTCSSQFLGSTSSATGDVFNATVNATSGAVIYSQTLNNTSCSSGSQSGPSSTPLGQALFLQAPAPSVSSGHYNYTMNVTSTSNGITWGNLTFLVVNSSTGASTVMGTWSLTADSFSGAIVGTFDLGTNSWASGATTPIVAGDSLVFSAPASMTGYYLQIDGVGTFSGSIVEFF
jgi:hypothetical protein